jgi:hypothetical protein
MEPDRSAERLLVAEAVASNQIEVPRKRRSAPGSIVSLLVGA